MLNMLRPLRLNLVPNNSLQGTRHVQPGSLRSAPSQRRAPELEIRYAATLQGR